MFKYHPLSEATRSRLLSGGVDPDAVVIRLSITQSVTGQVWWDNGWHHQVDSLVTGPRDVEAPKFVGSTLLIRADELPGTGLALEVADAEPAGEVAVVDLQLEFFKQQALGRTVQMRDQFDLGQGVGVGHDRVSRYCAGGVSHTVARSW